MIRVLHCAVCMNRGGAETFIMNVYRNINREKIQFDFLTSLPGDYEKEIEELGGRVYRVPYMKKCGSLAYSKYINKFFKQHKEYKIVHSHMDKMSGLILREAKKNNIPVRISHSHSTENEGVWIIRQIKNYYGTFIEKSATDCFACSDKAGEFLFPNREFINVANGINIEKFVFNKDRRTEYRKGYDCENKFVVGHVGRFSKVKNHKFLLQIFREFCNEHSESELHFAGSGSEMDNIKKQAEELGIIDKIKFLGNIGNINDVLQGFDVFVFPSLFEGLPVSLVEAQASGLKCIVSDTVTKEIAITDNIEFCSLNNSAKKWSERILEYTHGYERQDMSEILAESEYNINNTSRYLQEFYLSQSGR